MEKTLLQKEVPVIGHYETIVCGGGPAGWVAAVASARSGRRTALIERYGFLGGTATAGLVVPISGCFHNGKQVVGGIAWEFVQQMVSAGAAKVELPKGHVSFDPEVYKLAAWRMVLQSGVDLYTNAYLSHCETDGRRIKQIFIESKNGTEALSADVFIDATGDADLCHMAGAQMLPKSTELQPMSMCFVLGGVDLTTDLLKNSIHHDGIHCKHSITTVIHDYLEELSHHEDVPQFGGPWFNTVMNGDLVVVNLTRAAGDGTDRGSLTQAESKMRSDAFRLVELLKAHFPEFKNCTIVSTAMQAGVRDTRHIRGLHTVTGEEILRAEHYEDSIALCAHPMDIHVPHDNSQILVHLPAPGEIPYRSLVSPDFDNLLAAGRCLSADRDATATIRVQATLMAIGEAAGTAAGLWNGDIAHIDVPLLHEKLRSANAIFTTADRL